MKKRFVLALLAVALLTGCEEKPAPESIAATGTATTTSDPSYSVIYSDPPDVDDGAARYMYYDEEIIVVRCGDNYLCLGAHIDNEWLADDVPLILGEDTLPMGRALKITADIDVTTGGITGRTERRVTDIKRWEIVQFDEDITESLHHWEMSLQYSDWQYYCNCCEHNALALVYRYTFDGAIYALGNTSDKRVAICRNGEQLGVYDGIRLIQYPDESGEPQRVVLCNEGFDTDALVSLLEQGVNYNEDFYFIGATYYDGISEQFVEEHNYFVENNLLLPDSLTNGAEKLTLELSDEFYDEYCSEYIMRYSAGKAFLVKADSLLKLKRIAVNESNQPHLIFERIGDTANSDGSYTGILIAERAVAGMDFSDFTYEII